MSPPLSYWLVQHLYLYQQLLINTNPTNLLAQTVFTDYSRNPLSIGKHTQHSLDNWFHCLCLSYIHSPCIHAISIQTHMHTIRTSALFESVWLNLWSQTWHPQHHINLTASSASSAVCKSSSLTCVILLEVKHSVFSEYRGKQTKSTGGSRPRLHNRYKPTAALNSGSCNATGTFSNENYYIIIRAVVKQPI